MPKTQNAPAPEPRREMDLQSGLERTYTPTPNASAQELSGQYPGEDGAQAGGRPEQPIHIDDSP